MHPNSFLNAISSLLALVSASLCAAILLMISVLFLYSRSTVIRTELLDYSGDVPNFLGASLAHLLSLIPIIYFGAAFGRFALRAAPPLLTGRVRFGALLLTLIPLLVIALFPIGFLLTFFSSNEPWQTKQTVAIDSAVFSILWFIWFGALSFPLIKRHLKPLAFLERPYVLFLRRFSRFSDRTVINLVLRQTPASKPVVFLVAPHSRVGDWNPFLVGFAGMKLLHPFRSVPLCVKSENAAWEEAIQTLIGLAQFVIVDISEKSEAIEAELGMINEAGCWQKTILLAEVSKNAVSRVTSSPEAQTIHYRKNWIRGIPRMILGYLAMHVSLIAIFLVVVQSIDTTWIRGLCLLLGIPFLGWLYISF
ncbi:MAG TPA: hypothetical protein VN843_33305, partial [Anaerolineales bacterium]|nr:hypothetical protein [Anaerolineales bacterium]